MSLRVATITPLILVEKNTFYLLLNLAFKNCIFRVINFALFFLLFLNFFGSIQS